MAIAINNFSISLTEKNLNQNFRFKDIVRKVIQLFMCKDLRVLHQTKLMEGPYWIEACDPLHRKPSVLIAHFQKWKSAFQTKMSFWDYLKGIEVTEKDTKSKPTQVVYLKDHERFKYQISIQSLEGKAIPKDSNGSVLKDGKYNFVFGPDRQIYAVQPRTTFENKVFRHSSFFAGKSILAAGEFVIKNGILAELNSSSGHYKPTSKNTEEFLKYLASLGIDLKTLSVFETVATGDSIVVLNY